MCHTAGVPAGAIPALAGHPRRCWGAAQHRPAAADGLAQLRGMRAQRHVLWWDARQQHLSMCCFIHAPRGCTFDKTCDHRAARLCTAKLVCTCRQGDSTAMLSLQSFSCELALGASPLGVETWYSRLDFASGGDNKISRCIWAAGYAMTDPGALLQECGHLRLRCTSMYRMSLQ